ncbi:unnamed protein product [Pleuronectes platessa]|uniref:Uncharacterized protein n=1 Tax=Pleuronectes platessa TaxID=8262 RepID=A0A9N7TUJ2_PLEPL|nr:unnamed protein product [Pleuronectes platessa]
MFCHFYGLVHTWLGSELQTLQFSVNLNIRCERFLRPEEEFWVWIELNLVLLSMKQRLCPVTVSLPGLILTLIVTSTSSNMQMKPNSLIEPVTRIINEEEEERILENNGNSPKYTTPGENKSHIMEDEIGWGEWKILREGGGVVGWMARPQIYVHPCLDLVPSLSMGSLLREKIKKVPPLLNEKHLEFTEHHVDPRAASVEPRESDTGPLSQRVWNLTASLLPLISRFLQMRTNLWRTFVTRRQSGHDVQARGDLRTRVEYSSSSSRLGSKMILFNFGIKWSF